jgi:hypothetical protein
MERGLLWLPLLVLFIWLAWAGWNEYQKVETYQVWAKQFERAKYDIYSVLGQRADQLTWGQPSRTGPLNLQTFSLKQVQAIRLLVNGQAVDPTHLPTKGRPSLEFSLAESQLVQIPFTEIPLATQWYDFLQKEWQRSRLG